MSAETVVYLSRHAEPENPDRVFYGHLDGFGLSLHGQAQARGLGSYLRERAVQRVYASPLLRAVETARIAMKGLDPGLELSLRDDLVEASFGRYLQGVPRVQAPFRRPLLLVHYLLPGRLPMDETVAEMATRVTRVCSEAAAACQGQCALVVSHSDPIRAFWNRSVGRPDWRFHFLGLQKGAFLEVRYRDGILVEIVPHQPVLA